MTKDKSGANKNHKDDRRLIRRKATKYLHKKAEKLRELEMPSLTYSAAKSLSQIGDRASLVRTLIQYLDGQKCRPLFTESVC